MSRLLATPSVALGAVLTLSAPAGYAASVTVFTLPDGSVDGVAERTGTVSTLLASSETPNVYSTVSGRTATSLVETDGGFELSSDLEFREQVRAFEDSAAVPADIDAANGVLSSVTYDFAVDSDFTFELSATAEHSGSDDALTNTTFIEISRLDLVTGERVGDDVFSHFTQVGGDTGVIVFGTIDGLRVATTVDGIDIPEGEVDSDVALSQLDTFDSFSDDGFSFDATGTLGPGRYLVTQTVNIDQGIPVGADETVRSLFSFNAVAIASSAPVEPSPSPSAVPAPSSAVAGLLGLGLLARRRRGA